MNQEVLKAMNKSNKEKFSVKVKKVLKKIDKIILYPVCLMCEGFDELGAKYQKWQASKNEWDEARAKEIFDYFIPRRCNWNEKDKTFYYFNNGYGWDMAIAKKYLKRKDRTFWKIHCGWWGNEMRKYLCEKYELEGFRKIVYHNYNPHFTEISFKLIEDKVDK